jgi:hypothetical protein
LTIKIHPESILGTPSGTVWSTTVLFDTSKATCVAKAVLKIKETSERSYCLAGVMGAPPNMDPVILVTMVYLGSKTDGERVFEPLLSLGPEAVTFSSEPRYVDMNEAYSAFETKGGFKRWQAPGITRSEQFQPEDMAYLVEQHAKIAERYPSAKLTGFVLEFTSNGPFDKVLDDKETAFSHRDVACWVHLLAWSADEEGFAYADKVAMEIMKHVRKRQPRAEYSVYQNFSRDSPIQERYKGVERLRKLKDLKKRWDPEGIFTKQLL